MGTVLDELERQREGLIQEFGPPCSLYRILALRRIHSPVFLERTLSYARPMYISKEHTKFKKTPVRILFCRV